MNCNKFSNVKLIEAVKSRRPIWNVRDSNCKLYHLQLKLWIQVRKEMNWNTNDKVSTGFVRRRWAQLRSTYLRSKRLQPDEVDSDDGKQIESLKYAHLLSFLDETPAPTKLKFKRKRKYTSMKGIARSSTPSFKGKLNANYMSIKSRLNKMLKVDQIEGNFIQGSSKELSELLLIPLDYPTVQAEIMNKLQLDILRYRTSTNLVVGLYSLLFEQVIHGDWIT